jgi:hypothetical protein
MPTLTIPLTTIAQTDPDLLLLPTIHPDAALRLRFEYAFLSPDLTITIRDHAATFTWPDPTPAAQFQLTRILLLAPANAWAPLTLRNLLN